MYKNIVQPFPLFVKEAASSRRDVRELIRLLADIPPAAGFAAFEAAQDISSGAKFMRASPSWPMRRHRS